MVVVRFSVACKPRPQLNLHIPQVACYIFSKRSLVCECGWISPCSRCAVGTVCVWRRWLSVRGGGKRVGSHAWNPKAKRPKQRGYCYVAGAFVLREPPYRFHFGVVKPFRFMHYVIQYSARPLWCSRQGRELYVRQGAEGWLHGKVTHSQSVCKAFHERRARIYSCLISCVFPAITTSIFTVLYCTVLSVFFCTDRVCRQYPQTVLLHVFLCTHVTYITCTVLTVNQVDFCPT